MNLNELIIEVKKVAKEAGLFIKNESLKFNTDLVEYKDVNNVVSYVDKETERLIVDRLSAILPEAGFITEEGTVETEDINMLNWIIDPLDGTANFIHGLPNYSVSLALARGKDVLLGVVYNVCTEDMFWATKGGGAFRNDTKISVSKVETFGQSLLATGFPYYKFENMDKYILVLESLMQKTHGLRR
jgi:myo-inositol-1(or 4)-monophosphatase